MSILFFNLRDVPGDEAEDIRTLLTEHQIGFYETTAGLWGISLPAIWLYQTEDLPMARKLFDEYQQQRTIEQRARYQMLKQQGLQPGFWLHNFRHPIRFVIYSIMLAMVFYISVKWVLELGR